MEHTCLCARSFQTVCAPTLPKDVKETATTLSLLLSTMLLVYLNIVCQMTQFVIKSAQHHTPAQHHGENGVLAPIASGPETGLAMNLCVTATTGHWSSLIHANALHLHQLTPQPTLQHHTVTKNMRCGSATTTSSNVMKHVEA